MEYGRPSDGTPQFVQQQHVPLSERGDGSTLIGLATAPLVAAMVQLFWAALDDPPLEPLAWLIEIAAVVCTAAFAMDLARLRGVPLPLAIVIGIVAAPFLIIAAMFVVIAAAFSLGSII